MTSGRGRVAVAMSQPRLMTAAWCIMSRMLEALAGFLSKKEWEEDSIEKWKNGFEKSRDTVDDGR